MLGGEEELKTVQVRGQARNRAAASSAAVTITTAAGEVLTISEFISLKEESTSRRLSNMDQMLKDLERQMEALETEMGKANECVEWS
ncbi:hypothetical protein MA16_Dca014868 [Dendrobium catenatum]|uniref:Uncharacterized protein n=1 Tax=Dendrobium catenatum TaxID=906689 RepID=A0A2I0V6U4_9ASPA|nr:hypothetical protein MA16_Dca014868 [Dendrobium catenatum]